MNQNIIIGIVVFALFIFGGAWLHHDGFIQGQADIQDKWNIEESAEQKAKDEAVKLNEDAKHANELQHQKDIDAAKTQAGRAAIDGYLTTHGLLPAGATLHCEQSANHDQAISASGVNAATSEQGTSYSIAEFAGRCASDALSLMRWQEWATREQLPVK